MLQIGKDLTNQINELIKKDDTFVISDENVAKLYPHFIKAADSFIIEAGEHSKSLEVYGEIINKLIEVDASRATTIVALGGGVVGDLAGFVAATYMRGLDWVSVPTTLLAQVDSGIGGKTAVNFEGYKNIIGAFHSAKQTLISYHFLDTLPPREMSCGLGEIIKTAFLYRPLKSLLDESANKLINFDKAILYKAIEKCVEFKSDIVKKDEKETTGLRKCLNLGHTIGHALEKEDEYRLTHGEYVLWGLWYETALTKNYISLDQYLYMTAVLRKVLKGKFLEFDSLMVSHAATHDKKNSKGRISMVAAADMDTRKELFFSQNEIYEGLELCKRTYRL